MVGDPASVTARVPRESRVMKTVRRATLISSPLMAVSTKVASRAHVSIILWSQRRRYVSQFKVTFFLAGGPHLFHMYHNLLFF